MSVTTNTDEKAAALSAQSLESMTECQALKRVEERFHVLNSDETRLANSGATNLGRIREQFNESGSRLRGKNVGRPADFGEAFVSLGFSCHAAALNESLSRKCR